MMKLRKLLIGAVLLASLVNVLAASSKTSNTFKKAAGAVGAGFVGYKLGKFLGKFPNSHYGESLSSCSIGSFTL